MQSGSVESFGRTGWPSRILELLKLYHIQLALATGASIIALSYVSKHVLPQPMKNLTRAFPPFLAVVGEAVIARYKDSRFAASWLWVLAVLLSTTLLILLHLI